MNPLLNIGSILFLIGGAAGAIIGAATPFVTRMRLLPLDSFLMVADSDRALFGDSPQHLFDTSPAIAHL